MSIPPIHVTRTTIALRPDQSRVLIRPFYPGDERRTQGIVARILSLPEDCVLPLLNEVLAEFSARHHNICDLFRERFEQIRNLLPLDSELTDGRKLLIGSYFVS